MTYNINIIMAPSPFLLANVKMYTLNDAYPWSTHLIQFIYIYIHTINRCFLLLSKLITLVKYE